MFQCCVCVDFFNEINRYQDNISHTSIKTDARLRLFFDIALPLCVCERALPICSKSCHSSTVQTSSWSTAKDISISEAVDSNQSTIKGKLYLYHLESTTGISKDRRLHRIYFGWQFWRLTASLHYTVVPSQLWHWHFDILNLRWRATQQHFTEKGAYPFSACI